MVTQPLPANPNNVILTGPHRSGTTFVCYLLNQQPGAVALHEPMQVKKLESQVRPAGVCAAVEEFFSATRASLLTDGTAISKHFRGEVPDNDAGAESRPGFPWLFSRLPPSWRNRLPLGSGLRQSRTERGMIRINKPLQPDFLLVIKHPAAFTALVEDLTGCFRYFAIVRNPLAILASWNSVRFKWEGRSPVAERLDPHLGSVLKRTKDRLDRQILLLSWFFQKYDDHLPAARVLRYEDVISSGGTALEAITRYPLARMGPLENKNTNPLYNQAVVPELAARLLSSEGSLWRYYTREEVESLANRFMDT